MGSQKISLNILTYPFISYHIPTYPKISSGANSQMEASSASARPAAAPPAARGRAQLLRARARNGVVEPRGGKQSNDSEPTQLAHGSAGPSASGAGRGGGFEGAAGLAWSLL